MRNRSFKCYVNWRYKLNNPFGLRAITGHSNMIFVPCVLYHRGSANSNRDRQPNGVIIFARLINAIFERTLH